MCGIAGYITSDSHSNPGISVESLKASIEYRGRDDSGLWTDEQCACLFHTRLIVIDLITGHQPMIDVSGRYVIVFNGEIYNYEELRAEYANLGANFRTHSDTEIILEGFKLKGENVCRDLNGMFAFAIWDTKDKALFLARDRLGKKPLFWTSVQGVFYFSSSLDSFKNIPGWRGILSKAAIDLYGLLGSFPGEMTIYEGASAIPPATFGWLRVGETRPRLHRYWRMSFAIKSSDPFSSLLEKYESLLTNAVHIRLRSDVPLALTFSGGVDSGTIAAICANRLQIPLKCYTIDYHTDDDPSDETIIAERVSSHLGLQWQHIHFDYHSRLLTDLLQSYNYYDQPCQQLALVYSRHLYEAIKPYATVVLSGNGADELFTGYIGDERARRQGMALDILRWLRPLFHYSRMSPYLRLPLPDAFAETLINRAQSIYSDSDTVEKIVEQARWLANEAHEASALSALDFKMFIALASSASDSNYRLPDISGLAAQIEVRSPFLDYRMVEFASHLPHKYKVSKLFSPHGNKFLPKRYYERHVPREIVWSRKKGMGWNLRWDRSIAYEPDFMKAFADAYDALDKRGIPSASFRSAWNKYIDNVRAGTEYPAEAGVMMNGFMLGVWVEREVDL